MEIFVGRYLEEVEHLVEHRRVLPSREHAHVESVLLLQSDDDGRHFYGLGTGSYHADDFFSIHREPPLFYKKLKTGSPSSRIPQLRKTP